MPLAAAVGLALVFVVLRLTLNARTDAAFSATTAKTDDISTKSFSPPTKARRRFQTSKSCTHLGTP